MVKKTEFENMWDNINPNERLELIYNQINVWLPYQYQDFKFINYQFSLLPDPVSKWLIKYYKPKN